MMFAEIEHFFGQNFLYCLYVAIIVCAAFFQIRKLPHKFPPGSEGFPLLGSLPMIGRRMERTLAEWGWMEYGSVFYFRAGFARVVVLNTFEAVQEGFSKKGNDLSGRFNGSSAPHAKNLAFSDFSPEWKDQRKYRISTLKGFEKRSIEAVLSDEARQMCDNLMKWVTENSDTSFLPAEFTTIPTFNAVSMTICGQRIEFPDNSDEALKILMDPIYHEECLGMFSIQSALKTSFFMKDSATASQQARVDFVLKYTKTNNDDGFVSELFHKVKSSAATESDYFQQEQLVAYLTDLFLAGTDTMATTVAWALVLLAANPRQQSLVQEEIENVLGTDIPTMANYDSMHYTRAAMQEVFRMRPVFPLSIGHMSTRDTTVLGYHIPNNTTVLANLWAIQNDAKYWKNPEEFHPERHLNDKKECVKSEKIIPFSIGPRYCLGGQIATVQHFFFLVTLLQKFTFKLAHNYPDKRLHGLTSIVLAPRGIKLAATVR